MFYRSLGENQSLWYDVGGGGGRTEPNKNFQEGGRGLDAFSLPPQTENESNHDMHLQCQGGLAWLDLFFKC